MSPSITPKRDSRPENLSGEFGEFGFYAPSGISPRGNQLPALQRAGPLRPTAAGEELLYKTYFARG